MGKQRSRAVGGKLHAGNHCDEAVQHLLKVIFMVHEVNISDKNGATHTLRVESCADGSWKVDGATIPIEFIETNVGALLVTSDTASYDIRCDILGGQALISVNNGQYAVDVLDPRSLRTRRNTNVAEEGPRKIKAPMPGKVVRVLQVEGDKVDLGQGIIVIEAMKMQNELKTPKTGTVKKINFKEGDTVNAGETLAVVE